MADLDEARAAEALRCVAHAAATFQAALFERDVAADALAMIEAALPFCRRTPQSVELLLACAALLAARGQGADAWRRACDDLRFAGLLYHRRAAAHFHARVITDAA